MGVAIALACDQRLSGEDARFTVTPLRLGLIYSHDDALRLVRAIGAGPAREMLLSALAIEAAQALRLGLIERLWPAADFDAASEAYGTALEHDRSSRIDCVLSKPLSLQHEIHPH